MDVLDEVCLEIKEKVATVEPLEKALTNQLKGWTANQENEIQKCLEDLDHTIEISFVIASDLELSRKNTEQEQQPILELKQLPTYLKYVFLRENGIKLIILNNTLPSEEEARLVKVLKANKDAIGWTLSDSKAISPSYCMHKILMRMSTNLWLYLKGVSTPLWRRWWEKKWQNCLRLEWYIQY